MPRRLCAGQTGLGVVVDNSIMTGDGHALTVLVDQDPAEELVRPGPGKGVDGRAAPEPV